MLALDTGPDFKIGRPIRVYIRGEKQLVGIATDRHPVGKFDDGQTIIEDFKCRFLSFSIKNVAHHKDRLPLPLDAEIA